MRGAEFDQQSGRPAGKPEQTSAATPAADSSAAELQAAIGRLAAEKARQDREKLGKNGLPERRDYKPVGLSTDRGSTVTAQLLLDSSVNPNWFELYSRQQQIDGFRNWQVARMLGGGGWGPYLAGLSKDEIFQTIKESGQALLKAYKPPIYRQRAQYDRFMHGDTSVPLDLELLIDLNSCFVAERARFRAQRAKLLGSKNPSQRDKTAQAFSLIQSAAQQKFLKVDRFGEKEVGWGYEVNKDVLALPTDLVTNHKLSVGESDLRGADQDAWGLMMELGRMADPVLWGLIQNRELVGQTHRSWWRW